MVRETMYVCRDGWWMVDGGSAWVSCSDAARREARVQELPNRAVFSVPYKPGEGLESHWFCYSQSQGRLTHPAQTWKRTIPYSRMYRNPSLWPGYVPRARGRRPWLGCAGRVAIELQLPALPALTTSSNHPALQRRMGGSWYFGHRAGIPPSRQANRRRSACDWPRGLAKSREDTCKSF